jgi:hypothetical protein
VNAEIVVILMRGLTRLTAISIKNVEKSSVGERELEEFGDWKVVE